MKNTKTSYQVDEFILEQNFFTNNVKFIDYILF